MKRLYLIRHAKSSWNHPGLSDFERPLNKRGLRDAPVMGERLAKKTIGLDLMVSSPAVRAITTARMLAEKLGYPESEIAENEAIYGAHWSGLMEVVQNLKDESETVMLLGHNPGFTMLAEYLTDTQVDNMPTCSVFGADFDVASWGDVSRGKGSLVHYDFPKNHPE